MRISQYFPCLFLVFSFPVVDEGRRVPLASVLVDDRAMKLSLSDGASFMFVEKHALKICVEASAHARATDHIGRRFTNEARLPTSIEHGTVFFTVIVRMPIDDGHVVAPAS